MDNILLPTVFLILVGHVTCQDVAKFQAMTTTSSVAVTWTTSMDMNVTINGPNKTKCQVKKDDVLRICALTSQNPSARYDIKVIQGNGWTELLRATVHTKPNPPRNLTWVASSREIITVEWLAPEGGRADSVDGYVLVMVRQDNNMTAFQEVARTRLPIVRRRIYLPRTYNTPYGTSFTLKVWSQYQDELSNPVSLFVPSAPRPVPRIEEDGSRRTNSSTTLKWYAPDSGDVTEYRMSIRIRDNAQARFQQKSALSAQNATVHMEPGTPREYTFNGLTPASMYDVNIWAVYHGAVANTDRTTTANTNPSPVRALSVSFVTTDTVTLSWALNDPFLPVGFDYVITAESNDHRRQETARSTAISAEMRYLRPGGLYRLAVRIKMNTYPNPTSLQVTTTAQLKPNPVSNIRFYNLTDESVNVTWSPGYGKYDSFSVRYHGIYVRKQWSSPVIAPGTDNYVVINSLHPGETYYFGVSAISGNQLGLESTNSITIAPKPPASLQLHDGTVTDTSAIVDIISDPDKSASTEWRLEYGVWNTGRYSYIMIPASSSQASLRFLNPGLVYTVRAYSRTTGRLQSIVPSHSLTIRTKPRFRTRLSLRASARSIMVSYPQNYEEFDDYVFMISPGDERKYVMKFQRAEFKFYNLLPGMLYTISGQVTAGKMMSDPVNETVLTHPEVFVECGATNQTSVELLLAPPYGQVDEYLIYCNPGCAYEGTVVKDIESGQVTSHVVTGMNPDTSYQFRAKSRRTEGRLNAQSRVMIIYCRTARRPENE